MLPNLLTFSNLVAKVDLVKATEISVAFFVSTNNFNDQENHRPRRQNAQS